MPTFTRYIRRKGGHHLWSGLAIHVRISLHRYNHISLQPLLKLVAACLAVATLPAAAQSGGSPSASAIPKPSPPITALFNRNLIFIDPAHGGPDTGAHLNNQVLEKDVTLALANKLREVLSARGFTVVLSRQSDDPAGPSLDDRAGTANHFRPVACILVHATAASRGVHLYTSSLIPPLTDLHALPWDTAQASWVPQSVRLANELGTSLARAHTPVVIHHADPKPLSSLTCPAIALEIAPLSTEGGAPTPVTDTGYQQRVANAIAGALVFWKNHADPAPSATPTPAVQTPTIDPPRLKSVPAAPIPKPVPKTKPAPPVPTKIAPESAQLTPRRANMPLPQTATVEATR